MAGASSPDWGLLIFWFLLAPPIGACIWRLMARGWAMTVQGGQISERTKRRQHAEFWILLWGLYAIEVVILIIAAAKGTL